MQEVNSTVDLTDDSERDRIYTLCSIYRMGHCNVPIDYDDLFRHGEKRTPWICQEE